MSQLSPVFLLIITAIFFLSCSEKQSTTPSTLSPREVGTPLQVYTTTYPVAYLTGKITGEHAEVTCPVPANEDPIFWMPSDTIIATLQKADAIVLNGAGFAKWIDKVSLPESAIIDSSSNLMHNLIRYETATTHSHGKTGEHSHEGIDGHTWIAPENTLLQAETILRALQKKFPHHTESFAENHTLLAKDISAFAKEIHALQLSDGTPLLASHPAYNYLARQYSWNIANLDLDPDIPLTDAQWKSLTTLLQQHPAKLLLWESEPTQEISASLKKRLGITSLVFSPCETTPPTGDYLSIMQNNVARLRQALHNAR